MSLSHAIAVALDEADGDQATIVATDGGDTLSLHVEQATPVGLTCRLIEFRASARDGGWSADALRAWGQRLAARITYLMEPLVVIETDPEAPQVALRSKSTTPNTRGDARAYYEFRLDGAGMLRLQRIAFLEVDRARHATTFQLTREVVERLASDLAASAR